MAGKKKKNKSNSVQQTIRAKVFYLSMVMGFSLFGLYIAYDTYADPETRGISAAVLIVSLIALGLTMLNIFVTRLRLRHYMMMKRTQGTKKRNYV